jgi:hypothetical protein
MSKLPKVIKVIKSVAEEIISDIADPSVIVNDLEAAKEIISDIADPVVIVNNLKNEIAFNVGKKKHLFGVGENPISKVVFDALIKHPMFSRFLANNHFFRKV